MCCDLTPVSEEATAWTSSAVFLRRLVDLPCYHDNAMILVIETSNMTLLAKEQSSNVRPNLDVS